MEDITHPNNEIKPSFKNIYGGLITASVLVLVFLYDAFNPFLGFFDEFIALIAFIVITTNLLFKSRINLYREEIYISILLLLLLFLGLASNYITLKNNHPTPINAIIGDLISFIKAYMVYYGIRMLASKINSKKIIDRIAYFSEWIFYFLIFLLLIDLFFKIFPQYPRFGFHSFQLFFTHTSRYGFAFVFIFLVLFPKYYKRNNLLLILILLAGVLSLRVKYFGFFIFAVIFLYNTQILKKISKKLFIFLIFVFIIVLGIIFKDQISMYFYSNGMTKGWSRAVLLNYSFVISNDFFPFGTGFGTYASYFSGKFYSWVYELYQIDGVYGISRQYWEFISDQFWPMVLGQFGYFGLFSYLGIIYLFFKLFLKQVKNNLNLTNYRYIPLLGLVLLLIDSSSDAIFTQNRAVAMFILFALFTNMQKDNLKLDEKN